jgi:hypothetical protein
MSENDKSRVGGLEKKLLPEHRLSSPEPIAWIEEEVTESLRVKRALLLERAETLAAICAALVKMFERDGKLLEVARSTPNTSRQSLSGATGDGFDGQQLHSNRCGE